MGRKSKASLRNTRIILALPAIAKPQIRVRCGSGGRLQINLEATSLRWLKPANLLQAKGPATGDGAPSRSPPFAPPDGDDSSPGGSAGRAPRAPPIVVQGPRLPRNTKRGTIGLTERSLLLSRDSGLILSPGAIREVRRWPTWIITAVQSTICASP